MSRAAKHWEENQDSQCWILHRDSTCWVLLENATSLFGEMASKVFHLQFLTQISSWRATFEVKQLELRPNMFFLLKEFLCAMGFLKTRLVTSKRISSSLIQPGTSGLDVMSLSAFLAWAKVLARRRWYPSTRLRLVEVTF